MTTNDMPDVIWVQTEQSVFQRTWYNSPYLDTVSYTRTDLLEQRAKVAAENAMDFINNYLSNVCGEATLGDSLTPELTAIILSAMKGETK